MCGSILKKKKKWNTRAGGSSFCCCPMSCYCVVIKTCSARRKLTDNSNWQYKCEKGAQTKEREDSQYQTQLKVGAHRQSQLQTIYYHFVCSFLCYFGKQTWGIKICTVDSYDKQSTGDTFTCLSWLEIRPAIAWELLLPHTQTNLPRCDVSSDQLTVAKRS